MKLIQTFFRDKNFERYKEYLFCIQKNINSSFIDSIHFLIDEEDALNEEILKNEKIIVKKIDKRLEFGMALEYARDNFSPKDIVALANLDIFFEHNNAWHEIHNEFFLNDDVPRAMALCRTEYSKEGNTSILDTYWIQGWFADAWIFQVKYLDKFIEEEDLEFCVGLAPNCDDLMFKLMNKHFKLFNWAEKYRIMHYDACRKGDSNERMILTAKVDYRAQKRAIEPNGNMHFPAFQNWEEIFEKTKDL